MTNTLIYFETSGDEPTDLSLEMLQGGRVVAKGGGTVTALIVSDGCNTDFAATLPADKVIIADDGDAGQGYTAERHANALKAALDHAAPDVVIIPNSYVGIELSAWIAATSNRPLLTYCNVVSTEGDTLSAICQGYEGKLLAKIECTLPAVACVNSGAFGKPENQTGTPDIELLSFDPPKTTKVVRRSIAEVTDVDITASERLVSVGRGIGEEDNIEQAQDLAALMQAELGASRPLIDQGWVEKSRQVGKSGKTVVPKLYMAMGISGAPEHLEGMRDAELIIAVNTDPSAPIFDVAHYGTTCDVLDLIPELTDLLEG